MDICQVYGPTAAKPTHAISDMVAIRRIRPNPPGFVQDMLSPLTHPQVGSSLCSEVVIRHYRSLAVRIGRTRTPVSPIRCSYLQYDARISNTMLISPIRCQYLQYGLYGTIELQNRTAWTVWQLARFPRPSYVLKVAFCTSPYCSLSSSNIINCMQHP
jgi:hypothetical protein